MFGRRRIDQGRGIGHLRQYDIFFRVMFLVSLLLDELLSSALLILALEVLINLAEGRVLE